MKKEFSSARGEFFSKCDSDILNFYPVKERVTTETDGTEIFLPISIFGNSNLSALEAITKYMKEEVGLRYRDIAFFLNRDERTIWGSYYSSKIKMPSRFVINDSALFIPCSLLS